MNTNNKPIYNNISFDLNLFQKETILYNNATQNFLSDADLLVTIKNSLVLLNYNLIKKEDLEINNVSTSLIRTKRTFSSNVSKTIVIKYKKEKQLNFRLTLKNKELTIKCINDNALIQSFIESVKQNLIDSDVLEIIDQINKTANENYKNILINYSNIQNFSKKYKKDKINEKIVIFEKNDLYNENKYNYTEFLNYLNKGLKENEKKTISSYSINYYYALNLSKNLSTLLEFLKVKIYYILIKDFTFKKKAVTINDLQLLFNNYFNYFNLKINTNVIQDNDKYAIIINNHLNKNQTNYSKVILGDFTINSFNQKSKLNFMKYLKNNSSSSNNAIKLNETFDENEIKKIESELQKFNKFGLEKDLETLIKNNNIFTYIFQNYNLYTKVFNNELQLNLHKEWYNMFCLILNNYLKTNGKDDLLKFICIIDKNNSNKLICYLVKNENMNKKKDLYLGYFIINLVNFFKTDFVSYEGFNIKNVNKNLNNIFPSNFIKEKNNIIKLNKDLLLVSYNENQNKYNNLDKFINILNTYIQRVKPLVIVICTQESNYKNIKWRSKIFSNTNFQSILQPKLTDYHKLLDNTTKKSMDTFTSRTLIYYKNDVINISNKIHTNLSKVLIKKINNKIDYQHIYNEISIQYEDKIKKFIFINGGNKKDNTKIKDLIDKFNLLNKYKNNFNIFLLGEIKNERRGQYFNPFANKKTNIKKEKTKSLTKLTIEEIQRKKHNKIESFYNNLQKSINKQVKKNTTIQQSIFYMTQKKELIIKDIKIINKKIRQQKTILQKITPNFAKNTLGISKNIKRKINSPSNYPICLKVNLKL